MKTILTLFGDHYHDRENLFNAFRTVLEVAVKDWILVDTTVEDFESFLDQQPTVVVIARENRINPEEKDVKYWMTQQIEEKIKDYVQNGGRLFVWHSGLASYPENGVYCSLVKGYFKYHPDKQKLVRYHSDGKLVFGKQKVNFSILDEHYFVYCDEKSTNVYLYSESEDGKSLAGWWHNFGKGKVVVLTPAHSKDGLFDENFQILLKMVVEELFD
ncbi:ThuA domain-containing protein [Pseudothermotoga thermarum]|uniref:ThuA-like domain-containing protein n=1 Tax=Pseudothermotoga thermarum DSM 5069 TaxID=688269 RepID=F7YTZ2_9THEM|nr:ThuA domain-containing protein [Pseudothermotoga thermarum]AEH51574.1 hypothetical protein Theth_1521 [Pseudothermotoga thermarum DSM 5069]